MFTEICIPKGNEKEFLEIAEELGIKSILFLYDKIPKELPETKIKIFTGLIDKTNPNKTCVCKGIRKNVEDKKINILYGFEELEEKDSPHYRKSGINQVIAKLMQEKNKLLLIDTEKLLESKDQPKIIGRIKHNLMLANKYKVKVVIGSLATKPENMRSETHYKALIKVLGTEKQAKDATKILYDYLRDNSNI